MASRINRSESLSSLSIHATMERPLRRRLIRSSINVEAPSASCVQSASSTTSTSHGSLVHPPPLPISATEIACLDPPPPTNNQATNISCLDPPKNDITHYQIISSGDNDGGDEPKRYPTSGSARRPKNGLKLEHENLCKQL